MNATAPASDLERRKHVRLRVRSDLANRHAWLADALHASGRMQVLTSSGAGTWGPPLRVNTRSEIVLIHFE